MIIAAMMLTIMLTIFLAYKSGESTPEQKGLPPEKTEFKLGLNLDKKETVMKNMDKHEQKVYDFLISIPLDDWDYTPEHYEVEYASKELTVNMYNLTEDRKIFLKRIIDTRLNLEGPSFYSKNYDLRITRNYNNYYSIIKENVIMSSYLGDLFVKNFDEHFNKIKKYVHDRDTVIKKSKIENLLR